MTIVSAPGKVLIAGGYLVLERPNPGLVLSTSARFYATVKPLHSISDGASKFWSFIDVRVSSPQMDSERSYKLLLRTCKLDMPSTKKNFVENAIEYGVAAALAAANNRDAVYERLLQGLDIEIKGSNDFYSFRNELEARKLPLTAASLASLPQFHAITRNIETSGGTSPEVAKSGLGSSAAMTTAIVAGILEYLGVIQLGSGSVEYLDVVHAASQAAHCHAQGKIGSGFDVSAAVYGSQKYVRFSPGVLSPAMDPVDDNGKPKSLEKAMKSVLDMKNWNSQRSNFALPPMLFLVLGESGRGGSHTPSMVGAVNAWREKHPNAEACWRTLAKANENVEADLLRLKELHETDSEAYTLVLEACSSCGEAKWNGLKDSDKDVVSALLKLRQDFSIVRSLLRQMGEEAKVPLEPGPQSELLDETMELPGVLFAGVPGAGGWDAVFAITIGKNSRRKVEQRWSERSVLTLTVEEDPRGVCVEEKEPTVQDGTGLENQVASILLK
ncbi:phosphomevalonate kinase, peroxisomal [Selaginella moellendorffii]|uniref:phosphomevalonate kinase, peroxisomal n=1 Tax=Selaginella moellendorffii TaxID=88036 RepID=UPI000D1C9762|nr:phosphomevalonate kinase, peroxisomal [Selaginella moellendorffii]|eukprot:XP_024526366.1 phosphomevalonate kinase, peroxisomal [Selaginella moellendorffii]